MSSWKTPQVRILSSVWVVFCRGGEKHFGVSCSRLLSIKTCPEQWQHGLRQPHLGEILQLLWESGTQTDRIWVKQPFYREGHSWVEGAHWWSFCFSGSRRSQTRPWTMHLPPFLLSSETLVLLETPMSFWNIAKLSSDVAELHRSMPWAPGIGNFSEFGTMLGVKKVQRNSKVGVEIQSRLYLAMCRAC